MLFKEGSDYIYVCKPMQLDKESESVLFTNSYITISAYTIQVENKKIVYYYRVKLLKRMSVKVMKYTILLTIPKAKLPYKLLLNRTPDDVILVQYSYKGNGYIAFGKTCTELNV